MNETTVLVKVYCDCIITLNYFLQIVAEKGIAQQLLPYADDIRKVHDLYKEYKELKKEYNSIKIPYVPFSSREDCDELYQEALEASWERRDIKDQMDEVYERYTNLKCALINELEILL